MIDAKCLVGDWQSKEYNATTIYAKLITRFREEVPAYSSVTNGLQRLHFDRDIFEPEFTLGNCRYGQIIGTLIYACETPP
jgi:hypothetical protein